MFGRKAKKKGARGEEEFTLNTSLATLQTLLGRNGHGPAKPPSSTSSSTFSSSSVAVFSDPPSSRHSTVHTKASGKKGLRRAPLQDVNAGRSANRPEPARKPPPQRCERRSLDSGGPVQRRGIATATAPPSNPAAPDPRSVPREPVPVNIFPSPDGIGISCHSLDGDMPGIKIQIVDPNGPCFGTLFAGDRIIKIADDYVDRLPIEGAMRVLEKHLLPKPTFVSMVVTRPMKRVVRKKSKKAVRRPVATDSPANLYRIVETSPEPLTWDVPKPTIARKMIFTRPDSPRALAEPTTPPQAPALPRQDVTTHNSPTPTSKLDAAPTAKSSAEEIAPVSAMGAADLPRPIANPPASMAKVHRVNKVLKAAMEQGNGGRHVLAGSAAVIKGAPKYPVADLSMMRRSIAIDELSMIHTAPQVDSRSSTPEEDPAMPTQLSVYIGKNTSSLGMRMIGARKRSGVDRGIFVGNRTTGVDENAPSRSAQLLMLGDQIIKVNEVSLQNIPNAKAAKEIKDALRGPNSVNLTILRYSQPSLADGRAEPRRTDADGLLRSVPAIGPRPPPQYANNVSRA